MYLYLTVCCNFFMGQDWPEIKIIIIIIKGRILKFTDDKS